jgi:excisionase family DNA binding protein
LIRLKNLITKLEDNDIERIVDKLEERIRPLLIHSDKPEGDIIFDIERLSQYLKVSKQWVYEKVHHNNIPYYKMGKYPRFRKAEIDIWLNKMKRGNGKKPTKTVRKLLEDTS